ncbi:putative metallopeptidase [Paraburkholderia kururiensis]|uniref:putative metallopeptidase n=1 Tax=Paraburkholderia kururiensis TaxID=984307 RepID=UPI0005AA70C1|nr:putative metallopeptidase [Paraburkholderia kururiensis]
MGERKKRNKAPETPTLDIPARPMPPEEMSKAFLAAPQVVAWLNEVFLDPDSPLYNEDHAHLRDAHIGALWTEVTNEKQMRRVAATAEQPMFRASAWGRARQEMQMCEWFGDIPDFVITIDARIARGMSDASWCALIEHELYHCAQALDVFGAPRFNQRTGLPVFAIKGHDVEEFVGVVRRYGAGNAAGQTSKLVEAANATPEFGDFQIEHCCGTCL